MEGLPPEVEPIIITKGKEIENVGREPASFVWYILQNYESLEGHYAFVQGNPTDHCPNLFEHLQHPADFRSLGAEMYYSLPNGFPFDNGFNIHEATDILGLPQEEKYDFIRGGQFIISAERIRRYSKEQYANLLEYLKHGKNCYALERLWPRMYK